MAERQPGEVLILLSRVMKKKRKRRKKRREYLLPAVVFINCSGFSLSVHCWEI